MSCKPKSQGLSLLLASFLSFSGWAQTTGPQIVQLTSAQLWERLEFSITNVPAVSNPFDPDVIEVDATFTLPSGRRKVVPGFWYQAYQRSLSGNYEVDTATGSPGWRLRFTPPESGDYLVSVNVLTNQQPYGATASNSFSVPVVPVPTRSGYVSLAAGGQYFQTGDGQPLRLIGENVCWYDVGTFDYDTWFSSMQKSDENYARIWMCPWAFGIEDTPTSLTSYSLQSAWQLDYVLQLAEQRGIYLLLSLDYHGMFVTQPDPFWGGNNYWPENPYNLTNGGPCAVANDFFTSSAAMKIYQKRLRYLIARYGYSQNLLAWEFFNEIDNDYGFLNSTDVAAWHAVMGSWLHTNDVFGHLVTTSLTGSSDRPEIWSMPQINFAAYHSYGEPGPATQLATVAQHFLETYGKPVMIGEFGTSAAGWNRTNDPYLRGFRQGLWGGALGGSVGTAMSWWWQNLQSDNVYPLYSGLGAVLNRTAWGSGPWTRINFQTAGAPPGMVGNALPGVQPISVQLPLSGVWGALTPGKLAVPGPEAAFYSPTVLNSFVHGTAHPDLRTPFHLNAWLTNNARLVMHLNSASDGAIMAVLLDGHGIFSTNIPNLDHDFDVDEEYNLDIPVSLPGGNHVIDITNAGLDWYFLDWVRLEQVVPANYAGNWTPSPSAIGLRGTNESLLYVVAPGASFPASATNATLPIQHGSTVTLTSWPAGEFLAEWWDPATATFLGVTRSATTNGALILSLPDYTEDLASIVYPPPTLTALSFSASNGFQMLFNSEIGGRYLIQQSAELTNWTPFLSVTNAIGSMLLQEPYGKTGIRSFFRAEKVN
jgi:hypothetical protein